MKIAGGGVYKIAAGSMVLFTLLNIGFFYVEYTYNVPPVHVYGTVEYNAVYKDGGEYLPADTKTLETNWRNVVTDETFVAVSGYDYTDGVTTFWCQNAADTEKNVEIPLLHYANYHAYTLDNQTELEIRKSERNFVDIVIPPGYEGNVKVLYKIPMLWKMSYIISAIAVIGIIVSVLYRNRFRKDRKVWDVTIWTGFWKGKKG